MKTIKHISILTFCFTLFLYSCAAVKKKPAPSENSRSVTGSFYFSPTAYDLEKHVQYHFAAFFKRHDIAAKEQYLYGNQYATIKIWPTDHQDITMAFKKNGDDEWFGLNTYLQAKLGPNNVASWETYSKKYRITNLDELASAFAQFYGDIANVHLNEPFSGDFSWLENYRKQLREQN